MNEVREVVLHGELGRRYGKVHHFAVASAAEAVRALAANFRGFEVDLARGNERGVAYQVWAGGHNLAVDDLRMHSAGRIYISPVIQGSKRAGALETILGVVLIVVGVVLDYFSFGTAGNYFVFAGVSMLAGGIIQMLAGVPNQDGKNRVKSAFFDGPVNTTAQGNPVPIGYGRMIVGSAVLSGGISIEDLSPTGGGGGGGSGNWPTGPINLN